MTYWPSIGREHSKLDRDLTDEDREHDAIERMPYISVTSDEVGVGLEADQYAGEHDHQCDRQLKGRCVYQAAGQRAHELRLCCREGAADT